MKNVFQTDAAGLYIGLSKAWIDPEFPDRWLIPAGAYEDEPPTAGDQQVAKRVGDEWFLIPDFRGFEYWMPDYTKHVITEAGIEPPENHLTEDPGPSPQQIAENLKRQAQALLDKSDQTVGRCYEAGIPVPQAWRDYRSALRAVVSSGSGVLPTRPDYPPGT